jgi:hypothetical protein
MSNYAIIPCDSPSNQKPSLSICPKLTCHHTLPYPTSIKRYVFCGEGILVQGYSALETSIEVSGKILRIALT